MRVGLRVLALAEIVSLCSWCSFTVQLAWLCTCVCFNVLRTTDSYSGSENGDAAVMVDDERGAAERLLSSNRIEVRLLSCLLRLRFHVSAKAEYSDGLVLRGHVLSQQLLQPQHAAKLMKQHVNEVSLDGWFVVGSATPKCPAESLTLFMLVWC